jgi:hypothetical protein
MPHAGVQEGQEVVHALLHGQHLKVEKAVASDSDIGEIRYEARTACCMCSSE